MGFRWAITPAALGIAAAVGFAGVTGAVGSTAAASHLASPQAVVGTDWQGWDTQGLDTQGWDLRDWDWQPGDNGAYTPDYGPGADTATTVAEPLSATAAAAAEEITPSVVNIDTVVGYGSAEAAGTGIVIGSDGLVLTNHHVVEGATTITGTVVGTGKTYTATVLGYDPDTDVAVIDLTGAADLPVATLGDSDDVRVGDLVVGVGNAGGDGGEPTSVEGEVTALDQTITATDQNGHNAETLENLIGTNADIQSGQSGGPLVDAAGDVIGVDVAASSGYSEASTSGYAIPINDAMAVAAQILAGVETGTIQVGATPFLGVELAAAVASSQWGYSGGYGYGRGYRDGLAGTSDPGIVDGSSDATGVAIAGVVQDSAAETVGLSAGDTITSLDGTAITSAEQLSSVIAAAEVGDRLSITWTDTTGKGHSATVTLGAGPVG